MSKFKSFRRGVFIMIFTVMTGCQSLDSNSDQRNTNYISNREPLIATPYIELPLGTIQPTGWLHEQLRLAKEGMTGHLAELYTEVVGPRNGWLGGDGDGWERGPYWLDGLVPLAHILKDQGLIDKAKPWIEWTLNSQTPEGYFGPVPFEKEPKPEPGLQRGMRRDWWPHMVTLKVLQSHYSATQDQRVINLMTNYFKYQLKTLPDTPLDNWTNWGRNRGGENLSSVYWLYNITGDDFLLELGELLNKQTDPWTDWFLTRDLIAKSKSIADTEWSSVHGVNVSMAVKQPVIYYQQSKDKKYLKAVKQAFSDLEEFHGQVQGMYGNDELLHGTNPTQGTELCTAVELMFSLENIARITGIVDYMDHLEKVAYNALPAQIKHDFTARQYFQTPNQVLITRQIRNFITPHGGTDLCYGVLTGYPCCTTNMHQGWPKYVQNLWYASADNGLAALVYAPSKVTAKVADGKEVQFEEKTNYPFDENIQFTFSSKQPVKFSLHLRIPTWCKEASIKVNGKIWDNPKGGQIVKIEREWEENDKVDLELPMEIKTSRWHEKSVGIERGPLVYALRIQERWRKVTDNDRFGVYEEVFPQSAWNYGLLVESLEDPNSSFIVQKSNKIEAQPWTLENAPIQLKTKAKKIAQWKEYNGMAGPLPWGNNYNKSSERAEEIVLIPYGCTTLRISEFPIVY